MFNWEFLPDQTRNTVFKRLLDFSENGQVLTHTGLHIACSLH